jgi:protein tyrosine phosphatase (PTP) superfamily phosphohydrolase (DUF442 family)
MRSSLLGYGRQLGLIAAAATLVAASVAAPAAQVNAPAVGTENFGKVNENYYRGGQPRGGQYEELRRLGVRTVIDLRRDSARDEPGAVRAAGMRYFNIPLEASRPATDEQTAEFLRLVNDPGNWPVYVHCKGGRHRTGALTAVYRIAHDGWTAEQAFREMLQYDFDNSVFGGGGRARQKKFVFDYYERHAAEKANAGGKAQNGTQNQ